ncbi:hypothetical protein I7I53_01146 [Histoplasma capsulatum var. duboisii H88]|uniref:Uncharacterized protein n=1 Tax=Ajellomyces capsulatus (strain H88) TaxID=544711 RepID=A0A8A1LP51_AJEC8|nr:hypothetical protein I7I53_01146 [Histoplasma capsulatum var. duboisii H88]
MLPASPRLNPFYSSQRDSADLPQKYIHALDTPRGIIVDSPVLRVERKAYPQKIVFFCEAHPTGSDRSTSADNE